MNSEEKRLKNSKAWKIVFYSFSEIVFSIIKMNRYFCEGISVGDEEMMCLERDFVSFPVFMTFYMKTLDTVESLKLT